MRARQAGRFEDRMDSSRGLGVIMSPHLARVHNHLARIAWRAWREERSFIERRVAAA
jgi:hypothetical protein